MNDTTTIAVVAICVIGVLALVAILSRGKSISNWYKHENPRTSGKSRHCSTGGDTTDDVNRNVVDFKADIDCDKRKRRG